MRSLLAPLLLALAAPLAAQEAPNPLQDGDTWAYLAPRILGDMAPRPAEGLLTLEAPMRAEDAATVPIRLVQPEGAPWVQNLTLVIDENPSPVAAEMTFGEAMSPLDLELRVRVNQYSNVRAIAMTETGEARMAGAFVKASGGCSAPAGASGPEALAGLGEMRLREFGAAPDGRREAQVMIRHPQFSGLQRDQVTQLWIPAHFIERLEVWQGDEMLFTLTGGISISENPVFRFRYADNGAPGFRVRMQDTEGNVVEQTLPKEPAT
ncbi:quinoprotein dehydrogenase-associated SoxYZ-like carrier [Rubellimicrobium roseum]|uniref:Quinoprotein dehydrogenase-associated SoxYZ-like carrier n=1 Tax=Rubellimicrobium roseum TaxID=687525 RepID=A0A5C4N7Y5_9RHOB|nr:quinoprotein dehydrogenase-associated SoxYZ-like carrier [Rubellimicrobium roseum]TNC60038.1 quinoprotein dehydrogenase-associated SoxYZ-like carrier [Rubellimicrobium roseum]